MDRLVAARARGAALLTQVDALAAAVVAAWFFILAWRKDHGAKFRSARGFDLMQLTIFVWTLVAASVLIGAIDRGLLGAPDMQGAGNGSAATLLNWFSDRAGPQLPSAWVLSLPIFAHQLAMLAWALWLARSMIRWLPWAWASFSAGGILRPILDEKKDAAMAPAEPVPAAATRPP